MLEFSAWLDSCWSYQLFKMELEFIQPDDDETFELFYFGVKALALSPLMAVTLQCSVPELLVRTTLGLGETSNL